MGQTERLRQRFDDLVGSDCGFTLGGELRERLRELRVADFLAIGGGSDGLLRGGELRGELRAIAAVRLPRENEDRGNQYWGEKFCEAKPESSGHT